MAEVQSDTEIKDKKIVAGLQEGVESGQEGLDLTSEPVAGAFNVVAPRIQNTHKSLFEEPQALQENLVFGRTASAPLVPRPGFDSRTSVSVEETFSRSASYDTVRVHASSLWKRANNAMSGFLKGSNILAPAQGDICSSFLSNDGGSLERTTSEPAPTLIRPWSVLRTSVLRLKASTGEDVEEHCGRTVSEGWSIRPAERDRDYWQLKTSDTGTRAFETRKDTEGEYLRFQEAIQRKLDFRGFASQTLQRSYRCHIARAKHKDERFVQLEYPASVIVRNVKNLLARRQMLYLRSAYPLVAILKRNWRAPLARRRLLRVKFAKQHPKTYSLLVRNILKPMLDVGLQNGCERVINDWAVDVVGRSFRCHGARAEFWHRFDLIDNLQNDIGLEMTASILIQSMATSLVWVEKNIAAAKLQSCIRVPFAILERQDLQEYDEMVEESIIIIQCFWRCYLANRRVLMWDTPKCHTAVLKLQLGYRSMLAREIVRQRRREWEEQTDSAITIQTQCRVWLAKQRYWTRELDIEWPPSYAITSDAALQVQRVFRGHAARLDLRSYILSKFMMMHAELEVRQRRGAHVLQRAWRCQQARKQWAVTIHNSYSLLISRVRTRRRALEPNYDQLIINDGDLPEEPGSDLEQESSDEAYDGASDSSTLFQRSFSAGHVRIAKKLQAVFRGHIARANIKKMWGWDHQVVTQSQIVVWHKKMASKKIQFFWRGYRERKKFLAARREKIRKKVQIEAEFQADLTLRRVLLINRETRVILTAVEETNGTKVRVEKAGSAEIWSQVSDGVPAVWRVYREDNNVLCRVIVLTVHTPRDKTLKVSSTVVGIKPSLICTPGWRPPSQKNNVNSSSQPLVAENGLSLTTLLRMAARAGPNPSGFEVRDYTVGARLTVEEPSLYGDIWAKERGGVKIRWASSTGIASFIDDNGFHKVRSVEIMLIRGGNECVPPIYIAREVPDVGYYCWNVPKGIEQSKEYREGVWLRGGTEIMSDYNKRLEMQRTLRDPRGNILGRNDMLKFLEPEYQVRVRVKSLHDGKETHIAQGPTFIESISAPLFIVQPQERTETRRGMCNAAIRLLFPRGNDLVWTAGIQETIKWQTDGWVHSVRVSLLFNGVQVLTICENMLNIGVIMYKMPCNVLLGDKYQVRVQSKQDSRIVVNSTFFRVVDAGLGASEAVFSINGGVTTSLRHTTKPVTALVRQKMLKTRKAFGEEPRHVGELKPLDLQLSRSDGTILPRLPPVVKKSLKRGWDDGRGPNRLASSFLDRPEIKNANDRDLFEVFRPRTGPDKLDEWSREQEEMYNKWRQQKIQQVMAESGIEGEVRDWKDLMDEWEAMNNPQVAKAIAKEKERADTELANAQSLNLWEMMRIRYKDEKLQDPIEEWARIGAAAQMEVQRAKEASEATEKARAREEELKRRAAREAAKKASKFIMHEGKRIRATPAPNKPYHLEQENEWKALSTASFDKILQLSPPSSWIPVEQVQVEPPSLPDTVNEQSHKSSNSMESSLIDVYKQIQPGARQVGAIKPKQIRATWRSDGTKTARTLPAILPVTASSAGLTSRRVGSKQGSSILNLTELRPDFSFSANTSYSDPSRAGTAWTDGNTSEAGDLTRVTSIESGGSEAQEMEDRPSTSNSWSSSIAPSKGALGLNRGEEKTSKSGMLAAMWAKKTLHKSRAETKEQAIFKRLQQQNFQPISIRRRQLFNYQLEEFRKASEMSPDLYGNNGTPETSRFIDSWLPAAQQHNLNFLKSTPGEFQIDDVEMDEERLLDLSNVKEACSLPSRLDFDPVRMLGDADEQLDPIKAQQRAQNNEQRRRAIESRRSKNSSSRPTSNALSSLSSL